MSFEVPEGLSVKAQLALQKTQSKGSTIGCTYKRNAAKVTTDRAHLDKTRSTNNQTLINAAVDNVTLVMYSFKSLAIFRPRMQYYKIRMRNIKKVIDKYKIGKATISSADITTSNKSKSPLKIWQTMIMK